MSFDKAAYHYGGDFPSDLPTENGATHIGIFMAWVILNDLEDEAFFDDVYDLTALQQVRDRKITGRDFIINYCDEVLSDDLLSEKAILFARAYYAKPDETMPYIDDYNATLASLLPTTYHVADSWENYDSMSVVIDKRYSEWQRQENTSQLKKYRQQAGDIFLKFKSWLKLS